MGKIVVVEGQPGRPEVGIHVTQMERVFLYLHDPGGPYVSIDLTAEEAEALAIRLILQADVAKDVR